MLELEVESFMFIVVQETEKLKEMNGLKHKVQR